MRLLAWLILLVALFQGFLPTSSALGDSHDVTEDTLIALRSAPSLRLYILLKGENMNIHGQSVFDVFANPVVSADGGHVRYDGFATFIQEDSRFTYVLVDGAAYVVESVGNDITSEATRTVRCLSSITPFDSIVSALNTLKAVPSTPTQEDEGIDCSDGTLLKTSTPFGGEDFFVCASGSSGFIAYGGDMTMSVEYLDRPIRKVSAPTLIEGNSSCDIVAMPTSVTSTTVALLSGVVTSATCAHTETC